MTAVLPGATVGFLGGGQLGRMAAMAARALGYRVHALDPDPSCACRPVVERCVTASFEDAAAAGAMAEGCGVVTIEIEKVSLASMEAAARHAPVRPSAAVLAVVQDRIRQKSWLESHGFPVGPWRAATSALELSSALAALGGSVFAKSARGGYDGRGQARLVPGSDTEREWVDLGSSPLAVEKALPLEAEASVMVARRPSGESAVFPVSLNHHEERILDWNVIPAPLPGTLLRRAGEIGRGIAEALGVEGLLCVELFLLPGGEIVVNELAPRPHNSFHATEVGCATSQFEQLVRAVCDLPLGSTEVVRPAAVVNLLGDLWLGERPPDFAAALSLPGVRLHLYGKGEARPGRKMGHISAGAATAEEAVRLAKEARRLLGTAG